VNYQVVEELGMLKKSVLYGLLFPCFVLSCAANAQNINQPITDFKPLPSNAKVVELPSPDTLIGLDVYVRLRNQPPGSEDRANYNYVQQWLKQHGFTLGQTQAKLQKSVEQSGFVLRSNPMLIEVYGTLAATESAINTKFAVVNVDGVSHTWAVVAPSLPQDVVPLVWAIYVLRPDSVEFKSRSVFIDETQKK